jgi:thiamine biosynthesis protein ThiI
MMYRIAERFTHKKNILCLINGESVGQVASQTLQSMKVVEAVTKIPVLRPLITYDKLDIIKYAKEIGTYDISIRPFNDCCSVYLPKQPVTKPMEIYAKKYEEMVDFEPMIEEAVHGVYTLSIDEHKTINMMDFGLTMEEAIRHMEEMSDEDDHIQTE